MAFVRFKRFGRQDYAYRVTGKWDPVTKKVVQKSVYLGVVKDKEKGVYELRNEAKERERPVLDFGDSFLLHKTLEKDGFAGIVRKTFGDMADSVLALLHYRILYGGAMSYAGGWLDGNYAKFLYKAVLSSQRISELLADMGDEFFHRTFFQHYLSSFVKEAQGIVIDVTSLPNQIHSPLTAWGRSGEEIDKQVRFLLVVDKQTSNPIFFRVLAGNIVDVSTLHTTLQELRYFGVKDCFVYTDAGFFSEENVREMYGKNINFLSRLTSTRLIYKQLVKNNTGDLETYKHVVKYGKRGLFIKTQEIDLFGRKGFAYIVSDPERKGRETKKLLLETEAEKEEDEFAYDLKNAGTMILVSSFELSKEEVVPAYYARQMAEQLFGFEKDDLNILPLRIHGEKALAGFIFLQFMALIAFIQLKKELEPDFTVEEAMLLARNLKCKVYGKDLLINELTKQQKQIFEKTGIIVPNKAGI